MSREEDRTRTYLKEDLIQFHPRNPRPQTFGGSIAKDEVARAFHLLDSGYVVDQPTFRSEDVWIIPVNCIALCAP